MTGQTPVGVRIVLLPHLLDIAHTGILNDMKYLWGALTVLNYLLALFMMYAGIATAFAPLDASRDTFGWIYSSRLALVGFGTVFFFSGLSLFIGKVFKHVSLIGYSLMAIYLCFVFAAVLNAVAGTWSDGLSNLVSSGIVGLLYLRWKYKYHPAKPKE